MRFTIPGQPIGKPRMTQRDKWKQRACVMRYRDWADFARRAAGFVTQQQAPGIVRFEAHFEMPASWSKKKRAKMSGMPHQQLPDIDNIAKALLDALWTQDKDVWVLEGSKRWADGDFARMDVWTS